MLRAAVAAGVKLINTSDYYGPHVTNQIIHEALYPYPDGLTIMTKVGARRGPDASWLPALGADDLGRAVHDNLRNLGLDALDVVNLCVGGVKVPVASPSSGKAQHHFGWLLGTIAGSDTVAPSAKTRQRLGWDLVGPGLIADLNAMDYTQA